MSTDAEDETDPQFQTNWKWTLTSLAISAVIVVIVVSLNRYFEDGSEMVPRNISWSQAPPGSSHTPYSVEASSSAEYSAAVAEERKARQDQLALKQARARAELVKVKSLIVSCDKELKRTGQLTQVWSSEFEPLLKNDLGRQLASIPELVESFRGIFNEKLPATNQYQVWQAQLNEAARPLRQPNQESEELAIVSEQERIYFQELLTQVETANQALTRREELARSLLARASGSKATEQTLRQAIDELDRQQYQSFLAQSEQERLESIQRALVKQADEIRKAEEARIAAETELRVMEKRAKTELILSQKGDVQSQIDAGTRSALRRKLEEDFSKDQTEIESLLTPFLADSITHPQYGNANQPHTWIIRSGNPAPVSFGRLQASGSLESSQGGLHRLFYFAGSGDSIRPKGGFPTYSRQGLSDAGIVARLQRAQELLTKYGDLMVERGLLSP